MQTTKSFFAARGDMALDGPNVVIEDLELSRSDFVDLTASRGSDGIWLQMIYAQARFMQVESASLGPNAWIRNSALPTAIELKFSSPVDRTSIGSTTFRWLWSGSDEYITSGVTYSELDTVVSVPLPTAVTGAFTGALTFVTDGILGTSGVRMERSFTITAQVTAADVNVPQSGSEPYTAAQQTGGKMEIGRLTMAQGMDVDQMVEQFLIQKELESDDILKIVQVRGDTATEMFLLWWNGVTPTVKSISPAPNSTVAQENAPDQIIMEFDQPVEEHHLDGSDGTDRIFIDGTRYQDLTTPTLSRADQDGRVWVLSVGEITAVGNHTVLIRQVPNRHGFYPGPPIIFGWSVQTLEIVGGGGGGGTNRCETPAGVIDGANDVFTLTYTPITCSMHLFMNGVFQDPTCYTLVSKTITFVTPPFLGASLHAMYLEVAP